MVKRIFAASLAVLLLFSITACGKDPGSTSSDLPDMSDSTISDLPVSGSEPEDSSSDPTSGDATSDSSSINSTSGKVTTTTAPSGGDASTDKTKAPSTAEKSVSWWTTDPGTKASKYLDAALTEFETSTGIKVNMYIQTNSGGTLTSFDDKFIPAMSAGNGPDVTTFKNINPQYSVDITKEFDAAFWNQFFPMVRDAMKLDGKYYSTPDFLSVNGLLQYSKVDFKNAGLDPNSPPTTIAELDAMADKLFKANASGNGYTQVGFYPWFWLMMEYPILLVKPFGGAWTNEEGYPTANSDEVIDALEWMMTYVDNYGKKKVDDSLAKLINENNSYGHALAMTMSFGAQVNGLKNNGGTDEWGLTVFPGVDSKHNGLSIGLGRGYTIVKGSEKKAEALKFLEFMSTDYQEKYVIKNYADYGSYATHQKAWKSMYNSMDGFTQMMYDNVISKATAADVDTQMRQGKYTVPATYMTQVKNSLKKILNKEVELKAEMDSLQRKIAAQTKTVS